MPQPESVWDVLARPFPPEAVKERQGPKQHEGACEKRHGQCQNKHKMLSYVDARDVEARLDDAVTPAGWDFMATIAAGSVVHGTLVLYVGDRAVTRQDYGYPNGDDDAEPLKSAVSDAIKRCAVQFGVGRHLYTDNKVTRRPPQPVQNASQRPQQPAQRREAPPAPPVGGMTVGQALEAIKAAGIDAKTVSAKGKELYGQWSLKEMTPDQRAHVVEELTGGARPPAPDDMWDGVEVAA